MTLEPYLFQMGSFLQIIINNINAFSQIISNYPKAETFKLLKISHINQPETQKTVMLNLAIKSFSVLTDLSVQFYYKPGIMETKI